MTFDLAGVRDVIDPRHLGDGAIASYRTSFQDHPSNLVVLSDFLVPELAHRLTEFLTREAEFYTEYGLYSVDDAVDEATWESAPEDDRFFRMGKLAGTRPEALMSANAVAYLRFRKVFQDDDFRGFWELATGLELAASDDFGVHAMQAGHYLRPHSDDNKNRRLALVLYLSPEWRPEFGGALVVNDPAGGSTRIEPAYNSVVAFDVLTNTSHLVLPVGPSAGESARLTIGGWYAKVA